MNYLNVYKLVYQTANTYITQYNKVTTTQFAFISHFINHFSLNVMVRITLYNNIRHRK